jgi:hypothetical protein
MATLTDEVPRPRSGSWFRRILIGLGAVVLIVLVYYVGGALWIHRIADDPDFDAQITVPDNASRTVAVLADLIDREVNQKRWVANDPPFLPAYLLDNMPAYQMAMMSAVGRFTTELRDRIARVRGSSAADPDLERAAGNLNFAWHRCERGNLSSSTAGSVELVGVLGSSVPGAEFQRVTKVSVLSSLSRTKRVTAP